MFSAAVIKALQVYGIAIAVSLVVAVLIKLMVMLTGRAKRPATQAMATAASSISPVVYKTASTTKTSIAPQSGIPDEVIAAISAAISIVMGPHRILRIEESSSSWADGGRAAHHASHSGHFQPRH